MKSKPLHQSGFLRRAKDIWRHVSELASSYNKRHNHPNLITISFPVSYVNTIAFSIFLQFNEEFQFNWNGRGEKNGYYDGYEANTISLFSCSSPIPSANKDDIHYLSKHLKRWANVVNPPSSPPSPLFYFFRAIKLKLSLSSFLNFQNQINRFMDK